MLNYDEQDDDPQILKSELDFLFRRYARTPSISLARHIYGHLQKLLPHLDQLGFSEDRCCFYKLVKIWHLRSIQPSYRHLKTIK